MYTFDDFGVSCMKRPLPEPVPELPRSSGLTPPARPPSPPARLALDGDLDLKDKLLKKM